MSLEIRNYETKGLRQGRSKMGRAARILAKLNTQRAAAIEKNDAHKYRRTRRREHRVDAIVRGHYAGTRGLRAPPNAD